MKRSILGILLCAAAIVFGSPAAVAQGTTGVNLNSASFPHNINGVFQAPAYATYQCSIISGNSSTGSGQSIIVYCAPGAGGVTLRDGTVLPMATVFTTSTPIEIADGSNAEVFTPTAVSIAVCPAGNVGVGGSANCATLTGTLNNTHGQSAPVVSGDNGVFEAITDAGNQGGGLVFWQVDTGNVTLSTSGLTTTSTAKVPTNFMSIGASAIVETTITTSTNWAVGISGSTSAFCTANATLTAGTTCIANMNSPARVGSTNALTAVLITVTGANAGAGVVKSRVWGYTPVQAAN